MKLSEKIRCQLPKIINDVGHTLVTDGELSWWADLAAELEAERDAAKAQNKVLIQKISEAYGYLWHVNTAPEFPLYSPSKAAHKARHILRDTITKEDRVEGICKANMDSTGESHGGMK